jgi:hypothetical protein
VQTVRHRQIIIGAVTSVVTIMIAVCGSASTAPSSYASTAATSNTSEAQAWAEVRAATSEAQVLAAVRDAQKLQTLPNNVEPGLTVTTDAAGIPDPAGKCPNISGLMEQGCVYGDLKSKKLMVVYGDSHAAMWAEALRIIANRAGWRLDVFFLSGCQLPDLPLISSQTNQLNTQCQQFHALAARAIRKLHPNLLVLSSESSGQTAVGVPATPAQWQSGLMKTFASVSEPGTSTVMIGDIPQWSLNDADCLAAHMTSVQSCAVAPAQALSSNLQAEERAATLRGAKYIQTTAWACAAKCEPVINNIRVYFNQYHFGAIYIYYLSGALQQALGIPTATNG